MFNPIKPLAAAALMALAVPAAAHEAADEPAANADEILDMGQEVAQDGPQPGARYSREKHGDWDMACVKTEAETDPCSMLQMLHGPDGTPMAEVSMFRIDQEGSQAVAGATVIGPILVGVDKPIQICSAVSTANDILNMAVLASCEIG